MVIEPNIMGAVAGLREVAVTHSSATALPPPRANQLLDTGLRPRQPELAATPLPAQQIAPMPVPAALPLPSQAKTSTLPQPDTLAALADNLSNRPPPPRKSQTIVTRTHPIALRPELGPEPRVESQLVSELGRRSRPAEPLLLRPHPHQLKSWQTWRVSSKQHCASQVQRPRARPQVRHTRRRCQRRNELGRRRRCQHRRHQCAFCVRRPTRAYSLHRHALCLNQRRCRPRR